MRALRLSVFGAFFLAAALLAASPAWALDGIHLKPQVTIDSAEIRLGDVFDGVPADIDRAIARAPEPGKRVVYDVAILAKLARAYRLDWRPLGMNERSVLTRAANRIDNGMITQAVAKALHENGMEGEITVTLDNRNLEINLPTDIAPDFIVANLSLDRANARFAADLVAAPDSPRSVHVPLTGRAVAMIDVPVLVRSLNMGDVIGKSDLDLTSVPADRAGDMIRNSEDLIGKEVRRAVGTGQPIKSKDVAPPRLVLRGNLVTMRIATPLMQVTAQGRAMQDGARGEVIRVMNTQSNRMVEAMVEETGVVRIDAARKLASLP